MSAKLSHLLVVAAAATFASSCAAAPEHSVRPEQVTDFKELFEVNCAGCHGTGGDHGVAQPLNDPLYLALVNDARLTEVISRGVPGTSMSAFARERGGLLTAAQVDTLVKGMRRTWGRPADLSAAALPAYSDDDAAARGESRGDVTRGHSAFVTYCASCHGADGRGKSAGSVIDPAFLALTSNQSLRTTLIVGRTSEGIPDWRDYVRGRPMSNQDISDVVAWLSAQRGEHD